MKRNIMLIAALFFTGILSISVNAQETISSDDKQKPDYDQNIVVKKKPHPTVPYTCRQTSGLTRLRVTFDKSGIITDVELTIPSGCDDFDRKSIKAAKKIKFNPATKNGEPVTVKKTIIYEFSLFD